MQETVTASVLDLVGKIDSIERETEDIYLRLGKVFRAVKSAVDASAAEAEQAISVALGFHRGGSSADIAKRRSDDFIEDATRYFKRVAATEQSFLAGVEDGIQSLSRLDEIIGRIRADSEEMEIISLNAMTVALKSGAAGRAFSVITDELKRLSGRTIRHADELSRAGSALLGRLGELKSTLGTLAEAQISFFQSAKLALENGFISLESEIDQTAKDIRALSGDAMGVRNPISSIMQEVQLQDIIRQSLDHVRLSLGAAETRADGEGADGESIDPDEERAFLVEITRLSASLLDEVSGQVRASLGRFQAGIDGVNAVMASVESARLAVVVSRGKASAGNDYEARAKPYLSAKEQAMAGALAIADGVRHLDERFKEMNAILARFKSIVTASRIETARNKALAIVTTTVSGMMDLTERLTDDVAAAGGVTRSFAKALSTGMTDYLAAAEETMGELREKSAGLRDEFSRIDESRRRLWDIESDFRPFSADFGNAVNEASESVERIATLAGELEGMRDALEAYALATGTQAGNGLSPSIHSERLKAIVDRFTIFAHKQTAARIARLDSDVDDSTAESGDVTLF
jgi:methyl-accepting chemotaxis protein